MILFGLELVLGIALGLAILWFAVAACIWIKDHIEPPSSETMMGFIVIVILIYRLLKGH